MMQETKQCDRTMASFRLPKISDPRSSTPSERQSQDKRRRISTGSMRSSLPGSLAPSPPAAAADKGRPGGVRRRTLKRSMSVPGLALGHHADRCPSLFDAGRVKRGSDHSIRRSSVAGGQDPEELVEVKRQDMRVRAERESRAVSARVSDFCSRAAAASVDHRDDDRLIETVDCLEDADIAAERLFLNNTVLRTRQRRPNFMPSLAQGHSGAIVNHHQRDGQGYSDEAASAQPRPHQPRDSQSSGYDGSEPPDQDLGGEEAASEMVERISRWLEDVERLKRDPSEDLAAGISLVALT